MSMSTFHAVVWMDHSEAHVVMFDREHTQAQRIKSRSHHKHPGKDDNNSTFFAAIAAALAGTIVDSVATDHPSDAQLVALARQYFRKFDGMATDPSVT